MGLRTPLQPDLPSSSLQPLPVVPSQDASGKELSFQYTPSPLQPCPETESTELHLAVRRERRICGPPIRLTYSRKRKRGRQGQPNKKLLILDLNGVLLAPGGSNRPPYKFRPHCFQFLELCLSKFFVAIWSSKMSKHVDPVLKEMSKKMGKQLPEELKFVWGQDKCEMTSSFLKDNPQKPVMFKKLEKVWREFESYDTTNTVLVDDSPYKSILNPPHNAIFPKTYDGSVHDNYLDLKGEFVNYLTKLADVDDAQSYIRQNHIGYENIKQGIEEWNYYTAIAFV
ncbi:Haloacid dehalogenase-like hydrolase (HAD) superfamily protein [Striga hermonthica]|uniref:Mitochondrial import inner membrane translocase subunit TIM50 n=1 Tax=Striga hermonthica TaxID=68872 RepID=A0A9N7N4Z0_STRHE|nr:Haloacid dehalogenase-like hydrolase (HAD) superfamily protein [Striga hermonthica]